jgi:hypothetical protein
MRVDEREGQVSIRKTMPCETASACHVRLWFSLSLKSRRRRRNLSAQPSSSLAHLCYQIATAFVFHFEEETHQIYLSACKHCRFQSPSSNHGSPTEECGGSSFWPLDLNGELVATWSPRTPLRFFCWLVSWYMWLLHAYCAVQGSYCMCFPTAGCKGRRNLNVVTMELLDAKAGELLMKPRDWWEGILWQDEVEHQNRGLAVISKKASRLTLWYGTLFCTVAK